jgi:hypothetical protein
MQRGRGFVHAAFSFAKFAASGKAQAKKDLGELRSPQEARRNLVIEPEICAAADPLRRSIKKRNGVSPLRFFHLKSEGTVPVRD